MKKILMLAAFAFTSCTISQPASAVSLTVATGSATGTYAAMFKEMGNVCTNSSFLKERGTTGSLENIDLLLTNKASLAFVQLDVLKAKEKIDKDPNVNEIKVLLKLHNEEIHIITTKKPQGNFLKKVKITGYGSLNGKTVGAIGGAFVTAKVLSSYTGVKYNVVNFSTSADALKSLSSGKISAVIAVGGFPLAWVSALPSEFTLVPFESAYNSKLSALYTTGVKVSYPNLGGSFTTVSVPSILATRNFKTMDKKSQLLSYAKCVSSNLTTLQETEGYHPKWNSITKTVVDWPYYK